MKVKKSEKIFWVLTVIDEPGVFIRGRSSLNDDGWGPKYWTSTNIDKNNQIYFKSRSKKKSQFAERSE